MTRMVGSRFPVVLIAGLLLAPGAQGQPQPEVKSVKLQVEMACSPTKMRTSVARLSWRTAKGTAAGSRLEVTVYKDGFQIGAFARVYMIQPGQKFTFMGTKKGPAFRPVGLQLVVTGVQEGKDERGILLVEVEGLEAGLDYFWRVGSESDGRWTASETVRSQAPVCPSDEHSEKPKPPAR